MKDKKPDFQLKANFGQDFKGAKKFEEDIIKDLLEPLKDSGAIDFKAVLRRKCDFCERTIEDGEDFETIGEKDKCVDCLNKENLK